MTIVFQDEPPEYDTRRYLNPQRAFSEWCRSTSCHAINKVGFTHNTLVKVVWCAVFLVVSAGFVYTLMTVLGKYNANPVITQSESVRDHPIFPSVTVCNLNPLRASKVVMFTKVKAYTDDVDIEDIPVSLMRKKRQAAGLSPDVNLREEFIELVRTYTDAQREEMGHDLKGLIKMCSFDGVPCKVEDFTRAWSNMYGNCFTYNSGRVKGKLKTTTVPGELYGLRLIFAVEQGEYMSKITESLGVRVQLHTHGTLPYPEMDGFSLAPDTEASVGMTLRIIERMAPPYTSCNPDVTDKYGYAYSQRSCEHLCIQDALRSECGCVDPTLMMKDDDTPCDVSTLAGPTMACWIDQRQAMRDGTLDCGCEKACTERQYLYDHVGLAQYPAPRYTESLKESLNDFRNGSLTGYSSLKVYFKDLNYERVFDEPAYAEFDMLIDIGGLSALFLGISIVTVIELFELLVKTVTSLCLNFPVFYFPIDPIIPETFDIKINNVRSIAVNGGVKPYRPNKVKDDSYMDELMSGLPVDFFEEGELDKLNIMKKQKENAF